MSGEINFILNGERRCVADVPPTMTLLRFLREAERKCGTKEGCAEGDCGACTIALGRDVDGALHYQAVNSCLMLLPQVDGCRVLTVEGLAGPDGALHPSQQCLVDAHATQCGFCTPGFVMAMFALLQGSEPADDKVIHEALAGNLCRCTGYRSIVDACRRMLSQRDEYKSLHGSSDDANLATLAPSPEYQHGVQRFLAPRSLAELTVALLRQPDAIVLGGGTDLGLRVSKGGEALPCLVSTRDVPELHRIELRGDTLDIGGAATYSEALPHFDRHFPSLGALIRRIGSRQIRNLGTLAGNLGTASPIGDTTPPLLALDASLTLVSSQGSRSLPLEEFITGYRQTALAPREVIAAIQIPLLKSHERFAAYKVSKRFDQDIATVVAAFRIGLQDGGVTVLRAAFGGMAARVLRATRLESELVGRAWAQTALEDVEDMLASDFTPISDHRGGANYRIRAAAGLVRRFQLETTADVAIRLEDL